MMTLSEVSKLRKEKPREFDALVAEKVMGKKVVGMAYAYTDDGGGMSVVLHQTPENWSLQPVYHENEDLWADDAVIPKIAGVSVYALSVVPFYATSAEDDYRVLCHIRETSGMEGVAKFRRELWDILDDRPGVLPDIIQYYIGDYAAAALAVVMGREKK